MAFRCPLSKTYPEKLPCQSLESLPRPCFACRRRGSSSRYKRAWSLVRHGNSWRASSRSTTSCRVSMEDSRVFLFVVGKRTSVSRKADQIQRQCSLFSVANTAIKGDFETIALAPNKGLLIQEGNSNSLLLQ